MESSNNSHVSCDFSEHHGSSKARHRLNHSQTPTEFSKGSLNASATISSRGPIRTLNGVLRSQSDQHECVRTLVGPPLTRLDTLGKTQRNLAPLLTRLHSGDSERVRVLRRTAPPRRANPQTRPPRARGASRRLFFRKSPKERRRTPLFAKAFW